MRSTSISLVLLAACASAQPAPIAPLTPPAPLAAPAPLATPTTIPLPGATADGVGMDYLMYDAHTNTIWVPAGNTGSVDVIDAATGHLTRIAGFPTREAERHGTKRVVGPSVAALGDGVVYIGSRGDSSVCTIDEASLARGACVVLDATPDGMAYVARAHELWVTTPGDSSLRVLDAATLAQKARIALPEGPEGFAVDAQRGRFYTSFEDSDQTIAIDLATHATVATWKAGCGKEGPRGLRLATTEGLLFVACTARIATLAVDRDGVEVGSIGTGSGVDDLDYLAATRTLYAAAPSGTLTVAHVDPKGALALVATVPVPTGSRNGVVTRAGAVYLAHGKAGELVVVPAAR